MSKNRSKDGELASILREVIRSAYPELPRERVARALAGDRAAFTEVYETYEPAVRLAVVAAIRHRGELEGELEDFISEVWTRFVADGCWRLRGYDPERGSFGYYLRMRAFAIARGLAGRRAHRTATVSMTEPPASPLGREGDEGLEGSVMRRDELERLWAAMRERLDPTDLALFRGVLVEGRTAREVGAELELSEAAAARRSHRLRRKIVRLLEELRGAAGSR